MFTPENKVILSSPVAVLKDYGDVLADKSVVPEESKSVYDVI